LVKNNLHQKNQPKTDRFHFREKTKKPPLRLYIYKNEQQHLKQNACFVKFKLK